MTPDALYEKQWAITLLGRVMEALREGALRGSALKREVAKGGVGCRKPARRDGLPSGWVPGMLRNDYLWCQMFDTKD